MPFMALYPNAPQHTDQARSSTGSGDALRITQTGRSGTIDDDTLYTVQNPTNQELRVQIAVDEVTAINIFHPAARNWLSVWPRESLVIKIPSGSRAWFEWVFPNAEDHEENNPAFFALFPVEETAIPE